MLGLGEEGDGDINLSGSLQLVADGPLALNVKGNIGQTEVDMHGELVDLAEAAKMDGASAMTFFLRILLPLSKTNIAALVVIEFVYGWNQYLWPLLITTDPDMTTAVIGLQELIPQIDDVPKWNVALAGALLVMLPPILVAPPPRSR